jgi:hypothetical protein
MIEGMRLRSRPSWARRTSQAILTAVGVALTAVGCGLIGQEGDRNDAQSDRTNFYTAIEFFQPGKAIYWSGGPYVGGFHLKDVHPPGSNDLGIPITYHNVKTRQLIFLKTYKGPTQPRDPLQSGRVVARFLTETDQLVLLSVYPDASHLPAATVALFKDHLVAATRSAVARLPENWSTPEDP